MGDKVVEQLKELGSKLDTLPSNKDSLLKLLKLAALSLSEIDQSPPNSVFEMIRSFVDSIVKPELLSNQDKDVKLLVATCTCEITRITAPNAPYSDELMKEIFHLIVGTFTALSDIGSPSFGRRIGILETLAKYRSCVMMLDLECYDLVKIMFDTFFSVASDDHQENVLQSMQAIMVALIEENEDVREDLLFVILSSLGRHKKEISSASRKLAMNVIEQCAVKLEAGIKQFLVSSASRDNKSESHQIDYHEVIYDIYCCAPQLLSGIVPYLTGELLSDQLDIRLKAVSLIGDLFALPGSTISEIFQPVFSEFLKRLTDRVATVRMSMLDHVKVCLMSNLGRIESPLIIAALCDRLLDYDENVRKQVVDVICTVACHDLESVPDETVKLVSERLRDKSLIVKKYTMEKLAEIFRVYCTKSLDCSTYLGRFDWIPGKILRCFYDKDFRSDTIESIFVGSLFPSDFSAQDRSKHWVRFFSLFDKVEVKAFEKILEQKQRIQQELQRYLTLRQNLLDGDAAEIHKKVLLCFRYMSRLFSEPAKAEENLLSFDQLKDANIWKIMTILLDPNVTFRQACEARDELLQILGRRHNLHDFLSTLSMKCSFLLVNKDYVKEILSEATRLKHENNSRLSQSCMDIIVIVARFCPLLLCGAEEELVNLLKDENEILKEGALHILAKAGGTIREKLPVSSSSMDLILERLCLEGSRKQAKYAVHALAAITKDDGLKSLSILYKKLVDMLEENRNFPPILQSLGCIAQIAMPIFETRENDIAEYIKKKILRCDSKIEGHGILCWNDRSEICLTKIFGIKTLAKSYMPVKDAQLRPGIDELLQVLRNILIHGEVTSEIASSSVDKAHLKVACAKAILRLSRLWDREISVDLFYLTLKTVEMEFPDGRRVLLDKVHQYIKDRLLEPKYAIAFFIDPVESDHLRLEEEKQSLADIIQLHHQAKTRNVQGDANPPSSYPEFILPYLIHFLAHHLCPDVDECKDVKAYEPIYRKLHFFLSLLLAKDEDAKLETGSGKRKDSVLTTIGIFRSIQNSEDLVNTEKTKNSRAISELGICIMTRMAPKDDEMQTVNSLLPLPSTLYKPDEDKTGKNLLANAEMSWLTDENVLVHFESLLLETEIPVALDVLEGVPDDSEAEGNEVSLSETIKRLKGAKDGKTKKNKSLSTKVESTPETVDILKVVREINLDNLVPDYLETSNGHKSSPEEDIKLEIEHQGSKKRSASEMNSVLVPKRRRSLSGHSTSITVQQSSKTHSRAPGDSSPDSKHKKSMDKISDGTTSSVQKSRSALVKQKVKSSSVFSNGKDHNVRIKNEAINTKPNSAGKSDNARAIDYVKSLTGLLKKRKQGMPVLSKCSTKDIDNEDLIGRRIKVWWPMDKQFYEGTIKSYDSHKGKHVILYQDGDVEVLRLDKERWELADSGSKSQKKVKLSKGSTSTEALKDYSSGGSHKSKMIKKVSKTKPSEASKLLRRTELSDDSDSEAADPREGNSSGDSENRSDLEECDEEVLSISESEKFNQTKEPSKSKKDSDAKSKSKTRTKRDAKSSAAKSDSMGKEDELAEGGSHKVGKKKSPKKTPITLKDVQKRIAKPSGTETLELSEDEPLSLWKHKVGKLASRGARLQV